MPARPHDGYPKPPMKELTPAAQLAAAMDAHGAGRKEISEATGVAVTRVSQWRRDPGYLALRQTHLAEVLSDKTARMERDKAGAYEAADRAREMLQEDLLASDPEGHPIFSVRQAAAKILMEDKARTSDYAERGAKVEVRATVGAVYNVLPSGEVQRVETARADIEVKAEDVEEVEDDG